MTHREQGLARVDAGETWDMIIVGGGATGLGSALDAATRGYRTLLLEARDFAKGTSSRSTKLVHGGVRYLAQGRIGLVREALRERGRLLRNAPHLVHDLAFLVPAYHWSDRLYYGAGLSMYDLLAGRLGIGATRVVGRSAALELAPTLARERLRGGVVYHDGQFDDARLVIALLRSIQDHGGVAINGVEVVGLRKDAGGRVAGVLARDQESGVEHEIKGRCVLNATGVFADQVRRLDEPTARPMVLPSQGAHLVLDARFLPGETAIMVPKTDDGRVLFAIPWHDRVIIGTTDTPVSSIPAEPVPLEQEIDFLLKHAAKYLSTAPRPSDVLSVFAGLRPLIAPAGAKVVNTSLLSREHVEVVSDSGLVTVSGGKWTTYRNMAESAVSLAAGVGGLPALPCVTADLRLHGASDNTRGDWLSVYGSDAGAVAECVMSRPDWQVALHPRLPFRLGEAAWAAREEMARTVEDVLARRTRALFLDARASIEAAPAVASVLAEVLGRDQAWAESQVNAFRELAQGYLLPD